MDWNELLESNLAFGDQYLERATKDLTPTQLRWCSGPEANHIGWMYLHTAQAMDAMATMASGRGTQLWDSGNWASRMGLSPEVRVGGMKPQEAVAFDPPPLQSLQEYWQAVRQATSEWIKTLTPEDFDRSVRPDRPEFTVARCVSVLHSEILQHIGQIAYVRGLIDQAKIA